MEMLNRSPEMEGERLPIVSLCIVADKNRCPPNFVPITKTHDDGSDADLWKDGFGFGIFNRAVRYLAVSRYVADTPVGGLEVLTDLAVISDKEAVPSSFVCLDYTVDSKDRSLKKKYLCARFAPRNDALDAVTGIIVLARSKRPPKGYTLAGDIDGMTLCFRVSTIPEDYGRLTHSQSTEMQRLGSGGIYPSASLSNTATSQYRHSTSELDKVEQLTLGGLEKTVRGIDRVPFELNPLFAVTLGGVEKFAHLPLLPDPQSMLSKYVYDFRLERELSSPRN